MPSPDPFADRAEFPQLGGDCSVALARHQIIVSLLSFAISHGHVIWGRVLEGATPSALPLGIRLTAFAGFSVCALQGQAWSLKTIRISLFLGVISVLKHAMFGAPPYAWMVALGLGYPFWTYFCSGQVRALLCPPQNHRPSWWQRLAKRNESGARVADVTRRIQRRFLPVIAGVKGILASAP